MTYVVETVAPNRHFNVTKATISTSGVLIYTPPAGPLTFLRVYNSSVSNSVSFTRDETVGTSVTLNGPGTVTLAPEQYEVFQGPGPVPTNKIWAVGSAASTYVTIEQC